MYFLKGVKFLFFIIRLENLEYDNIFSNFIFRFKFIYFRLFFICGGRLFVWRNINRGIRLRYVSIFEIVFCRFLVK